MMKKVKNVIFCEEQAVDNMGIQTHITTSQENDTINGHNKTKMTFRKIQNKLSSESVTSNKIAQILELKENKMTFKNSKTKLQEGKVVAKRGNTILVHKTAVV
jgi:hypothetical protein